MKKGQSKKKTTSKGRRPTKSKRPSAKSGKKEGPVRKKTPGVKKKKGEKIQLEARKKLIEEKPVSVGEEEILEQKIAEPKTEAPEVKPKSESISPTELETKEPPETPPPQEAKPISEIEEGPKVLEIAPPIVLKELAAIMDVKPKALISYLIDKGVFATINQNLGEDVIKRVLPDFGFEYKKPKEVSDEILEAEAIAVGAEEKHDVSELISRAPVVTFMGHVDHGKTSLLDFIRKTRVVDKEKGGITQHIGAYQVKLKGGSVTFLDTPGHEAFTAMRARGANVTDVVVLVVAADDGVMPQTREAVDHARVAGAPIVVAINKCDLPNANIDKVKRQLVEIGLVPEDWGGKTISVLVSAKTGEGVENLLEMLLLEAELLELKANPKIRARGIVIEGKLSSGQGPVATVLVKSGTLRVGDIVLTGMYHGRIRAMINDRGERVQGIPPSTPASVLGLSGVPMAGDEFFVVKDEKKARTLSLLKQDAERERRMRLGQQRVTLEDFFKQIKDGVVKELKLVLKADVKGSAEALQESLNGLSTKDIKVNLIHVGVGNVNESDVMLALASNAVVMGFHVKIDPKAEETSKKENIEVKLYSIIYEAIADVRAAMEGLLEPYLKEVFVGRAQVRQVFSVSKVGLVAGSYVLKGRIPRGGFAHLLRDKKVVHKGKITSLKRFKDDVKEVNEGFECGIGLERHDDIKVGDTIEVYQIEKVARRLTK